MFRCHCNIMLTRVLNALFSKHFCFPIWPLPYNIPKIFSFDACLDQYQACYCLNMNATNLFLPIESLSHRTLWKLNKDKVFQYWKTLVEYFNTKHRKCAMKAFEQAFMKSTSSVMFMLTLKLSLYLNKFFISNTILYFRILMEF